MGEGCDGDDASLVVFPSPLVVSSTSAVVLVGWFEGSVTSVELLLLVVPSKFDSSVLVSGLLLPLFTSLLLLLLLFWRRQRVR